MTADVSGVVQVRNAELQPLVQYETKEIVSALQLTTTGSGTPIFFVGHSSGLVSVFDSNFPPKSFGAHNDHKTA